MPSANKLLKKARIFAGPNGSGKTTLFQELSRMHVFSPLPFINADLIESRLRSHGFINVLDITPELAKINLAAFLTPALKVFEKEKTVKVADGVIACKRNDLDSYVAAGIAEGLRKALEAKGLSFCAETVMSHESKIAWLHSLKKHRYKIYLYFVATDNPQINTERVRLRVEKGGHMVPADKIIARFRRSLELLRPALQIADQAYLFDNTNSDLTLCASIDRGSLRFHTASLPLWLADILE